MVYDQRKLLSFLAFIEKVIVDDLLYSVFILSSGIKKCTLFYLYKMSTSSQLYLT